LKNEPQGDGRERSEDDTIVLPIGYDPLALLNQVEGLYSFTRSTSVKQPPTCPDMVGSLACTCIEAWSYRIFEISGQISYLN